MKFTKSSILVLGYFFGNHFRTTKHTRKNSRDCCNRRKVMMPMRDGIRLATDIIVQKPIKVPMVLSRTPWYFNRWGDGEERTRTMERAYEALKEAMLMWFKMKEGGIFQRRVGHLGVPLTDGYDAFSWMQKQEWSNGKIGTLGCSSTAEWQWQYVRPSFSCGNGSPRLWCGGRCCRALLWTGQLVSRRRRAVAFHSWLYGVEQDKFKPRIKRKYTRRFDTYFKILWLSTRKSSSKLERSISTLTLKDVVKNVKESERSWQDDSA